MTNRERYIAAFAQVHAPQGAARRALNHLEQTDLPPVMHRPRRALRLALALGVVAACLMASVGAELDSGAVSNFLAPVFGGAQSDLVDDIGYPIGASASSGGYTVTADAVIGDRYSFAVVYTITREDGQPIPQNVSFGSYRNSATDGQSGGASYSIVDSTPGDNQVQLVETHNVHRSLFSSIATVELGDLTLWNQDYEKNTVLASGPWELTFALRYQDASVQIPIDAPLTVTGTEGKVYEIKSAVLSPLGFHMELRAPVPGQHESTTSDLTVSVLCQDGTVLLAENSSSGGSWSDGDETAKASYTSLFGVPRPLDAMERLTIGDTTIPLSFST